MITRAEELIAAANHELITLGNLDCIEKYFSPNYEARSGKKTGSGHDFVRKFIQSLRKSIPDVKVQQVEILSQSGNEVTWQRTLTGTHKKAMQGIPASGKNVTWTEMLVSRFDGDLIAEDCMVSELAGQLMIKLGRS